MIKKILLASLMILGLITLGAQNSQILGLGHGDSFEAAFAEAQMQIAQQISVNIQAVSELKSLDIEADGKAFYSQSIDKSIKLTVDQSISGIEVISRKQNKGVYEVNAALSIARLLNSLKGELDKLKTSAQTLVGDAGNMADSGKILLAIKNYSEAQSLLPELFAKKAIYDSFASSNYPAGERLSISALESSMRELISRLSFEVISGDNQSAPALKEFPQPIVFGLYYKNALDERVGVGGFPVKIIYGDGSLLDKGNTDHTGRFAVSAKAHKLDGQNKVICRADATILPAHLLRILNQNEAAAKYRVETAQQIEVAIKVTDEKGKRLETLERIVAKALSGSAFVVSERAELALEGILSLDNVQMQEGIGSPQYVAKVNLNLSLKRIATGVSLGSFDAEGVGISTKSEEDAIKNANAKVNINSRKFQARLMEYLEAEGY